MRTDTVCNSVLSHTQPWSSVALASLDLWGHSGRTCSPGLHPGIFAVFLLVFRPTASWLFCKVCVYKQHSRIRWQLNWLFPKILAVRRRNSQFKMAVFYPYLCSRVCGIWNALMFVLKRISDDWNITVSTKFFSLSISFLLKINPSHFPSILCS